MRIQPTANHSPQSFLPKTLLVSALVWLLVAGTFVLLPYRILNRGYLPDDDALRHAAKSISGKAWTEILLLRPEISIDHNPGWHVILSAVDRATGWNARQLVQFSVFALFVLVAATPLRWVRQPESWFFSLALLMFVFPYFAERLFLGRPFLVTISVTLMILCLWSDQPRSNNAMGWLLGGSTVLFALSAWIHGSWYLSVLIPFSFVVARETKKAVLLGICWGIGSVIGACFTGHPWTFLSQSALIPFLALGQAVPKDALVGEFLPSRGSIPALILIAGFIAVRKKSGRDLSNLSRDPVLVLAILGWLLGFRISRFWLDWGLPALALWIARELTHILATMRAPKNPSRLLLAGVASASFWMVVASDRNSRWSQYGRFECLSPDKASEAEWFPSEGGILYSVDMSVFYHTFFCNPHGPWRYALGFEPTFMRAEDRSVYFALCRTRNAIQACAPWIAKMTSKDRLVLMGPPQIRPAIPQLQWHYAGGNCWIGRL